MSIGYEIRPFDEQHPPVARDLAYLHATLLGHSPIPLLGPRFAEDFYYGHLPRIGFLFGAVAYVDDRPAGFAVGTVKPGGFLAPALQRPFWVAWLIAQSILRDPTRISAILEAWRRIRRRSAISAQSGVAEIVSMGVVAEAGAAVLRKNGQRISIDLLSNLVAMCRNRGSSMVRVTMERGNIGTQLLYTSLGWHRDEENILDETQVGYSLAIRKA